jgi:hypothetical protein
MKSEPEENEPVPCPHCGATLKRLEMQREGDLDDPRWVVRIAGRMNRAAIRGLARLLRGWADG